MEKETRLKIINLIIFVLFTLLVASTLGFCSFKICLDKTNDNYFSAGLMSLGTFNLVISYLLFLETLVIPRKSNIFYLKDDDTLAKKIIMVSLIGIVVSSLLILGSLLIGSVIHFGS
jgi:hypothetical protein